MNLPVSIRIGLRYTRAKRRNHFISFMALSSMLGIGLGVMVLITVLSVMNGFERELRERILGMASHVMLYEPNQALQDWPALAEKMKQHPAVVAVAPVIQSQAMLRAQGINEYVMLQGIDPHLQQEITTVNQHIKRGDYAALKSGEYGIILGEALARNLGVELGDKVTVVVVEGTTATPVGVVPRLKRFTVVATFEVKAEMDSTLALIHIEDAAKLLHYDHGVSGLRAKLNDVFAAPRVAYELRDTLGDYLVHDWTYSYGSLFQAIKMEKRMMFLILLLIIAIAAFNIVSALVMTVTDKRADIAILRTLGATPKQIMAIFITQGLINGLAGILVGTIAGVLLALNVSGLVAAIEKAFGIQFLSSDVYFVSFVPSQLLWSDVLNIVLTTILMSLLATIYPAWRAARMGPAEALRYE